jgi:hypothetical protein
MLSRQLNRRAALMAAMVSRSGFDAAVTIAARTPMLLTQGVNPSADQARETRKMVQEKVNAAYEGAMAAQFAWTSFMIKAVFGGVRSANDVSLGFANVAEAAMRPAQRSVRANAKRLSRRSKAL